MKLALPGWTGHYGGTMALTVELVQNKTNINQAPNHNDAANRSKPHVQSQGGRGRETVIAADAVRCLTSLI